MLCWSGGVNVHARFGLRELDRLSLVLDYAATLLGNIHQSYRTQDDPTHGHTLFLHLRHLYLQVLDTQQYAALSRIVKKSERSLK